MEIIQVNNNAPNRMYTDKDGKRFEIDMVGVMLNGSFFKMGYCKATDKLFVSKLEEKSSKAKSN